MTRQQHTAEPWERRGQSLYQEDDGTPGKAKYIAEFKSSDDAARALACVNACAGIPTEALESGALVTFKARARHAMDWLLETDVGSDPHDRGQELKEALAKLRGEPTS